MIEVHAPHEKMHGIKDFLLHILTITIGLLIALALEAAVEKVHQHHLRDEAENNIQQELRYNEHELQVTLDATLVERQNLVGALKFLQAKSEGKPYDIKGLALGYTDGTLNDANWRTATATGALGYMEYGRVENYAAAYQLQEMFARLDEQTLDDFLQLQSYVLYGFDPDKVTEADAKAAIPDVRKALSHVVAMGDVGRGLKATYEKALAEK